MIYRIQSFYFLLILLSSGVGAYLSMELFWHYFFGGLSILTVFALLNFKQLDRQRILAIILLLTIVVGGCYWMFAMAATGTYMTQELGVCGFNVVVTFLALRAITKDQKILRSSNRLR
ncbi:MAG: DUF4293 family protein [Flavobacteriaceae bacterium]